jgi:hypothetical protein
MAGMSSDACPVCKDWSFETLAGYRRTNGHGCPRCGQDGDMTAWLRRQVEADLARWVNRVAELLRLPEGSQEAIAAAAETEDAAERVNDAQAKLTLLNRYDTASARGDLGYDYRTGRHSNAALYWNALLILTGGYRHREGWRDHWPQPQSFQGN